MEKSTNPSSTLTWLQAAEHVLREEGPEMHIRDLTQRILEQGIVKSSCATSLETLLYRQTSGGVGAPPSKFVRVPGKHGWFGLRLSSEDPPQPMEVIEEEAGLVLMVETQENHVRPRSFRKQDSELGFEPRVFYTSSRKRKHSYPSSDESSSSESSGEGGVVGEDEDGSCDLSSEDEDDDMLDDSVYRKKYQFVKRVAKSMIHDNAALANQISVINDKILRAEEERKFLLDKLVHFQRTSKPLPFTHPTPTTTRHIDHVSATTKAVPKPREPPPPLITKAAQHSPKIQTSRSSVIKSNVREKNDNKAATVESVSNTKTLSVAKVRSLLMSGSSESENSHSEGEEERLKIVSHSSPRGMVKGHVKKAAPVTKVDNEDGDEQLELAMRSGKVRRLHPIAMNEDGSPVFPIVIGGLRVSDLGKIIYDRPAYHSERYLLPVGFESSRSYPSMIDPSKKCSYTCRILDGGETPIFEMVAEDDPSNPVRAASSTACQTIVLRNINKARDKQATNSGSGPEFFGYSNPTVLNLLQKMPDAKKCTKYKFVRFAEPKRSKKSTASKVNKKPSPSRLNLLKKTLIKKAGAQKRKLAPKAVHSRPLTTVKKSSENIVESFTESIAPVGSGPLQFGMESNAMSYSSSDELSSSSENDLVIDS